MRFSTSPEQLDIGGRIYIPASANATTFLILGNVVVHSREYHLTIINGLRAMKDANDSKTAKLHNISFSAALTQSALDRFNETWVGALGVVRAKNKAGRLWSNVKSNDGESLAFLSFWAKARSISDADLDLLRATFGLATKVFVEYQDSKRTVILPARPG